MPYDPTDLQGPGPSNYVHQLRAANPYVLGGGGAPWRVGHLGQSPMRGRMSNRTKGGLAGGYWARWHLSIGSVLDAASMTVAEVNAVIDELNNQVTNETYSDIPWEYGRGTDWYLDGAVDVGWRTYTPPTGDSNMLSTGQFSSWAAFDPIDNSKFLVWGSMQFAANRGTFINVAAKWDGGTGLTEVTLADSGTLDGTPKRVLIPHISSIDTAYGWVHMIFFDMTWEQYQAAFM